MADQAPMTSAANAPAPSDNPTPETAFSVGAFPERGVPIITGINRIGLWSLYIKEVRRFLKVHTQTIWGPAVTTLLFLVIFSVALGRGGREVLGAPFVNFVAPGLIMMGMMQNAFANSSFSLLAGKIQGTIIDLLLPPLSEGELMIGIVAAAVTRAIMLGGAVALAIILWPGVSLGVVHWWAVIWFGLMGSALLSVVGLASSIWAEKFDHNAAISQFIVAPLSLLSGTFYVIDNLAPIFQAISRANPFFYVISGFRYGFLGQSDIGSDADVWMAAGGLLVLNVVLIAGTYAVLKSGWKLKD